jgi:hypothetical protein
MAFVFQREDPVLDLGPKAHIRVEWNQRQYLLWPAWRYRVAAPEVRPRQLNILQKAVLGMCRAGVSIADEGAQMLHVHRDLAAFILAELKEKAFLDQRGLPTARGLEALRDETIDLQATVVGHVFQDPWSRDLWPRFVSKINWCEVDTDKDGRLQIVMGSKGNPWYQSVFVQLPPPDGTPLPPSPAEILKASRRHWNELRRRVALEAPEEDDSLATPTSPSLIDRVSMIDSTPGLVFLMTYLYCDQSGDGDWHACDPFGLGSSPRLRRAIEQRMGESQTLLKVVELFLGRSRIAENEDELRRIRQLRTEAELTVMSKLTTSCKELAAFEALVSMEAARKRANDLGEACFQDTLRQFAWHSRIALEAVLHEMQKRFPTAGAWKLVYVNGHPHPDRGRNANVYNANAKIVGFETPLPCSMSNMRPGTLKSAADHPDGGARATLLASVLAASERVDHPLRRVASVNPRFIDELDRLIQIGDDAAHPDGPLLPQAEVNTFADDIYRMVGLLTGLKERW